MTHVHPPAPVRLHTVPTAPNPRRVHVVMAEKGIELPLRLVDMGAREHYDPAWLARAGAHSLPALELEDGTILTETVAISRYLEAVAPEPNLFGRDAREIAVIEMWQRRTEFGVLLPVGFAFRHAHPSMAHLEDQVPEWAASNRGRVLKGMEMLNARLEETPYVAGDRITVADVTAWVALDFARVLKLERPAGLDALTRWQEELGARPGWKITR